MTRRRNDVLVVASSILAMRKGAVMERRTMMKMRKSRLVVEGQEITSTPL
jgi:hypothetical protein